MNPLSTRPNRWRPITVFNLLVGLLFSLSALGQTISQPGFYIVKGSFNWSEANSDAVQRGGHLATITSQSEQNVVSALVDGQPGEHFLLGATDSLSEGEWKWVTGEPFFYKNWGDGEPNNQLNEDMLYILNRSGNFWNDGSGAGKTGGYILEIETQPDKPVSLKSTYKEINGKFTWKQAYEDAIQRGGHLAVITTIEEQEAVVSIGIKTDCWLGGADSNIEGQWEWVTGEPLIYTNWGGSPQEPNGGRLENHLLIFNARRYYTWNDADGGYPQAGYILEIPATPPVQPPVFTQQPVSQPVNSGANVVFAVGLQTAGTYNYQWQLNEQNIAGATASNLAVNNAVAGVYRYRVIVSNSAGTVISDTATLSVTTPPAPPIITQPAPKTVQEGANVSFNVVATGQGAIVYQWQFNEQNLPGATSATLNLNGVKLNTAGRYRVLVSSQYGVTISDTVMLTVNPNPPPTIVTQPLSRTPAEGTQVSLTVTATGLGSLTYQWQINNQNIPGATSSTLVLSAVRPSANGNYRVIIGNPYGTTISTEVTVSVIVTDSDSDGLSDYEELLLGTNANKADTDGDGLSDFAEVRTHKSNPLTTDTDGDGYSDGIEVARDGNPNNRSVTPTGALAVFPAVDVEFYTLNSVKYQLEVSTDMVSWTAQGGVVLGNGGSQNHLVRASKATQFWRLKVVQ